MSEAEFSKVELTAYALGESVSGGRQSLADRSLQRPDLQIEVAQLQLIAKEVREAFAEPVPRRLRPERRKRILLGEVPAAGGDSALRLRRPLTWVVGVSAVLIVTIGGLYLGSKPNGEPKSARQTGQPLGKMAVESQWRERLSSEAPTTSLEEIVQRASGRFGKTQTSTLSAEGAASPWSHLQSLIRVRVKALLPTDQPEGIVMFLIDQSASMVAPNKLPMFVAALRRGLPRLSAGLRIGLAALSGRTSLFLAPTADVASIAATLSSFEPRLEIAKPEVLRDALRVVAREKNGAIARLILVTDGELRGGMKQAADFDAFMKEAAELGVGVGILGVSLSVSDGDHLQHLEQRTKVPSANVTTEAETLDLLLRQAGFAATGLRDARLTVDFTGEIVEVWRWLGGERPFWSTSAKHVLELGTIAPGEELTLLYEIRRHHSAGPAAEPLRVTLSHAPLNGAVQTSEASLKWPSRLAEDIGSLHQTVRKELGVRGAELEFSGR